MSPEDRGAGLSWEIIDAGQEGPSGARLQLSDSLRVFLQETSSFKQQNPGKFCLLVCSLCTFFAVLGRYIPGIVISYIVVLGVFLWPLISSHSLTLKPVLQKLDFGVGQFLLKIKENTEKKFIPTEHEALDSDLSSLFPKLNSTVFREMSVSDTEVSDVTWTENSTFNLSEGHTPQTETSDDLEKEEVFTTGFSEFPSLDNGASTNGDDDDDHSLDLLPTSHHSLQPITSNQETPGPHSDQSADRALELVRQMAGDAITTAVTAAIHDRVEAALSFVALCDQLDQSGAAESTNQLEESDSEVEDFELLDQSELEQLEGELGLEEKLDQTKEEPQAKQSSSGFFFSKLLRRQ
ncbi:reticulophagy regulator 1-like [Gouania willdenowi]|uniref:Reticulophagy regulator 1-like n=1 Tax=Gouania willdenowi TaxID=441366 RepID=A0A8C5N6D0_GOUWI|nr:reticulophagy regulator 1-like [Gouania willdenowi]